MNTRTVNSIVNDEALEYAKYVLSDRAIPNMIDGLKPVQRFFLYAALKSASKEFKKVAALGGIVSEYGYNHGESAAMDAGALIANTWNNNLPILQGRGNFGSRLVQDAAQSRYIYCRVHENFYKLFKDTELAPEHIDPEHIPPAFYLPVIPTVLLNGVKGIATGFDTEILPHDPHSVVAAVLDAVKGNPIPEPLLKFPEFSGKIIQNEKWFIEGTYELFGKTRLTITEIPIKYDREKYVVLLDKLEANDKIVSYSDECGGNGFQFKVVLKRDTDTSHENLIKMFGLRQPINQRLNVIDDHGSLRQYNKAGELIADFVSIRSQYIQKRIDKNIKTTKEEYDLAIAKVEFIKAVVGGEIVLSGMSRAKAVKLISEFEQFKPHAQKLIAMNLYHMTDDEIKRLEKEAAKLQREYKYWTNTTVQKEFIKDVKELEL